MADEEHEDTVEEIVQQPAAAAPAALTTDELIDKWFSVEFAGTIFADTPDKCNQLRVKLENLKQILKIKE